MSLVKWGFIGLLALPAAEVAVFILVALTIGWLWTIAVFLATSLIGVIVLKHLGRADRDRFRSALASDGGRAIHLESSRLAAMIGGILLVLPGFITDIVGALLFLPQVRRWAGAAIGRAFRGRRPAPPARSVIDLAPDQWQVTDVTVDDNPGPRQRP